MSRVEAPEVSRNNLADLVAWLNLGDVVVLLSRNCQGGTPYHRPGVDSEDPKTFRVIYMDISQHASLGDEGEWPWYFLDAAGAVRTCSPALQQMVLTRSAPNQFFFTLGYSALRFDAH